MARVEDGLPQKLHAPTHAQDRDAPLRSAGDLGGQAGGAQVAQRASWRAIRKCARRTSESKNPETG